MAERISAVEDFLTCPVCLETFKEPVSLGCNHSFCSSCLHQYWDQNHTNNCPICRRSSKEFPGVNFALKELSISFSKTEESEAVCSKHPQLTPIFCLDELRAFCPVCEFSLHTGHNVGAESEIKEQLKTNLNSLKKKRDRVSAAQQSCEDVARHSDKQVEQCERHIRATFSGLHRFLKEEEESALTALRQERRRRVNAVASHLDTIREQLSSLDLSISAVEKHLQKDTKDFITHYTQTHSTVRSLLSQTDPKLEPGLLMDQAKVLGNVGFKVWEKMRGLVHHSPVILDPNTADESLCLSEDLTSVSCTNCYEQVPDNPERYSRLPSVLGSEGWTSGRHQWVVEVGDHPSWTVGVAKESVDRKGDEVAYPQNGYWCVQLVSGIYTSLSGDRLRLRWRPQKIQVRLDYDLGQVSFYNAQDMRFICSHKEQFSEKLFPYLSVGAAGDAKTRNIRICSDQ